MPSDKKAASVLMKTTAGKTMTEHRMLLRIMLSYAFSFALIDLSDTASMAIDGLIVSRGISSTALAAIGIADPTFKAVSLFCGIFAVGMRYVCSSYMVKGNKKKNYEVFTFGVLLIAAVAASATAAGFLFTKQICGFLGADGSDPELYEALFDYLRGWFVGIPGLICFLVIGPLVTLDGNKKCVTAATVLQSVLNVAGDAVSAFVLHSGTRGIGLSTGLAFDAAAILLISNFFRKRSFFRLAFAHPERSDVRTIFFTGLPRVTKYGCKMLLPLIVNRIAVATGGSAALAALTVKNDVAGFCLALGCGIAESVSLMGELFYHENDRESMKGLMRLALTANAGLNLLLSLLIFAASPLITSAFADNTSDVYTMALTAVRCLAASMIFSGMNAIIAAYLQSTKRLVLTHGFTVLYKFLSLAVCTLIFSKTAGLNGLFYAVPAGEFVTFAVYFLFALIKTKGMRTFDAFLMLPADFGYSPENSIYINAVTMDEVVNVSRQISDFCTARGIDRRRTYFSSLCMEELAGNVVLHGFTKDNKEHICNIRVIIENGEIIMRIRDDCRYFNMKERYEVMEAAGDHSNFGIRLVLGIAKDVRYVNLIGTNTLIITL